jgi:hypothetical protein
LIGLLRARPDLRDAIAAAIVALLVAAGIWASQGRSAAFIAPSSIVVQLSQTKAPAR